MPTKTRIAVSLFVAIATLGACTRDATQSVAKPANGDYIVQDWVLPAQPGSMAPDLRVAPDGRVLISWLNRQQGRRNVLQFASYTEAGGWQSLVDSSPATTRVYRLDVRLP